MKKLLDIGGLQMMKRSETSEIKKRYSEGMEEEICRYRRGLITLRELEYNLLKYDYDFKTKLKYDYITYAYTDWFIKLCDQLTKIRFHRIMNVM
jgi:hypothetical protein